MSDFSKIHLHQTGVDGDPPEYTQVYFFSWLSADNSGHIRSYSQHLLTDIIGPF
jgi:hypothetical protein